MSSLSDLPLQPSVIRRVTRLRGICLESALSANQCASCGGSGCVNPTKKLEERSILPLPILRIKKRLENIDGYREKDSYGLPQKCVSFQYDSGSIDSFCVRKMTSEDFLGQVSSRKRSFQVEETTTGESKKLKSCQEAGEQTKAGSNLCDGHLKEIERLKQALRQG